MATDHDWLNFVKTHVRLGHEHQEGQAYCFTYRELIDFLYKHDLELPSEK